jgi:pimeloyl-ACP methyl ester carboxylesterase
MRLDEIRRAPGSRALLLFCAKEFVQVPVSPRIDTPPPADRDRAAAPAPIAVRRIGSVHVGGRSASLQGLPARQIVYSPGGPAVDLDPNGQFQIEQMYAQFVQLQEPRAHHPLLLMHGGGMCGVTYETTPDGRSGWQEVFLRAGHDVWIADALERGRASWARSPEFFAGEPVFRPMHEAWELFRFGPPGSWHAHAQQRLPHARTRFPVHAFETFMKQAMPRWTSNDVATAAAYGELARLHGPFVLVAHSQGCNFAWTMALAHPQQVRAIVAIEPSGFPQVDDAALAPLRGIPQLMVWGDHLDGHPLWSQLRPRLRAFAQRLRQCGAHVDDWDLPALGVHGNSHMLMMDDNSEDLALRIDRWLADQGLMVQSAQS